MILFKEINERTAINPRKYNKSFLFFARLNSFVLVNRVAIRYAVTGKKINELIEIIIDSMIRKIR